MEFRLYNYVNSSKTKPVKHKAVNIQEQKYKLFKEELQEAVQEEGKEDGITRFGGAIIITTGLRKELLMKATFKLQMRKLV